MSAEYRAILNELKKKNYKPIYLLHGEEPYYIDAISAFIEENVLSEGEKSFNQSIIYGKEIDPKSLLDTLMRYPMMSSHQVVILKEAQQFRDFDALQPYLQKPLTSTIFVICYKYKKMDGRSKTYKMLSAKGTVMESKKLYDNQLPDFIESLAREKHLQLNSQSVSLLAEYIGTDLSNIVNALEKLSVNVGKDSAVTAAHIEKYIGISKEYNVFEFTRALVNRDENKAFRIAKHFEYNPKSNEPVMVLGQLYSFFSKALVLQSLNKNPYQMMTELQLKKPAADDLQQYQRNFDLLKTVNILYLLHEFDLKVKGIDFSGSDKSVLFTEMTYRILN